MMRIHRAASVVLFSHRRRYGLAFSRRVSFSVPSRILIFVRQSMNKNKIHDVRIILLACRVSRPRAWCPECFFFFFHKSVRKKFSESVRMKSAYPSAVILRRAGDFIVPKTVIYDIKLELLFDWNTQNTSWIMMTCHLFRMIINRVRDLLQLHAL